MKLMILSKYGHMAATTRQRYEQYRPYLKDIGIEVESYPLLDNNYLEKLYINGKHNPLGIMQSYIKRLKLILNNSDADAIWLNYELFPYLPGFLENILNYSNKAIIYDIDDAIFHNYDLNKKWFIKYFLGNKLHNPIKAADIAFCGNKYLASYIESLDVKTKIVPTVLDSEKFSPNNNKKNKTLRIGWIGSPSTWNDYLIDKIPMLKNVALKNKAKIVVMGADKFVTSEPMLEVVQWSEAKEVQFLQSLDIGIMPLKDNPWSRGKCGYKLIQYMSCGIPVIASPVGVNCEIVDNGFNGFLAENDNDWETSLNILLNDIKLRQEMGNHGRKKIVENYSIQKWGPLVANKIMQYIQKNS